MVSPEKFSSFVPMSVDDVIALVETMPLKTCSFDPMPTNLVKDCIDISPRFD